MSPLPGVIYEERDATGSSGPPLDTATAFIAGLSKRGPTDHPVFCRTPEQYEETFGGEFTAGYMHDAAQVLPAEGGAGAWFQRAVGPGAKSAAVKLADGTGNTAEVIAVEPGEWGNDLDAKVVEVESGFKLIISYLDQVVQESDVLADNAAAVAWAAAGGDVIYKDLGGADPIAADKALSGGTDDRASITDAHRKAALALFPAELGPGQVLYPGATTTAMYTALLEHAQSHNRKALLDGADTAVVGTLTTAAGTLRALGDLASHGGMFAPWAVIDGPAASTTRTIPYSIIQAGLIARRDIETINPEFGFGNPNSPAAGTHDKAGISRVARGLSQKGWTDAERASLNEAGVNVARFLYEDVITYGYRTLVKPTDAVNLNLNNRRLDMAIIAAADAIAQEFDLDDFDGRGRKLTDLGNRITSRVLLPYKEMKALFETPGEAAYSVDVSELVNPPKQLAEGLAVVEIGAKRSPLIEQIKLRYTKEAL